MSLALVEPGSSFNVPGRWTRDKEIVDLISHLDQLQDECYDEGRRRYNVDLLPAAERDEVVTQISLCQDDFAYAARNFFWILPKRGDEIPFSLWESQELVLDIMAKMKAAGKAQRLMIIKSRQLGMSTLIEALIAWRTMFFPNARGLVVSDDQDNSAELFSKLLHIYDHMPWWLKPMLDRRKEERLLVFDNPDDSMKDKEPGLHSRVAVQSASKLTGVGQGRTLNCVHVSEYCDYPDDRAMEIINEDLHAAIADDPETFAFLESTAKGAGRFAHKFWRRQTEMGERAHWRTLFLAWFMEKTHVLAPPNGWRPDMRSRDMRERASRDWVQCTVCNAYCEQGPKAEPLTGTDCYRCNRGKFEPVILSDGQLYWMHNEYTNVAIDSKSRKTLCQEQPLTAEEAFQLSGYQLFPEECIKFVASTIDKFGYLEGHFDTRGAYHAMIHRNGLRVCCMDSCPFDHSSEANHLKVWEEPIAGCSYVIGGDVSEGLGGNSDYSIGWVNRIGGFGSPDVHVATFRSNEIDPISFGDFLNFLGRWYNEALMSVEVNKFDSCFSRVRTFHMYPNVYRWKHVDSTRVESNKWGWWTTQTTKPRLWQTAVLFLKERNWIIRSENCYEEMLTFQKESPEDRGASAEDSFYDDELMGAMIALYTSHDMDWDENLGVVPVKNGSAGAVAENGQFSMSCDVCGHRWVSSKPISDNPHENKCPNQNTGPHKNLPCRSLRIRGKLVSQESGVVMDWQSMIGMPPEGDHTPSYDEC